jgi:mono/diheme cytochrome c family protein
VILAVLVALVLLMAWPHRDAPSIASPAATPELVARGRYIAAAADCESCHSVSGRPAYSGGRPFVLPFGTIYSTNITPDKATGVGAWTAGEFLRALRTGVRADGTDLYPAFPYTSYHGMSDDDALALWTYLGSLPAVQAPAPANSLTFPFNQRRVLRVWNLLFAPSGDAGRGAGTGEEHARGDYLVNVLGHCGECHTPRNVLYGLQRSKALSGAVTDGWSAWNITSDAAHGIGGWTVEELAGYLRAGYAPGRGVASGPMDEVVRLSLRHMSDADLHTMAVYLKGVPANSSGPAQTAAVRALAGSTSLLPAADEQPSRGRQLFANSCAGCHGWDGQGLDGDASALASERSVHDASGRNVMQVVLHGSAVQLASGRVAMPGFARGFTDSEVAALTNYVLGHFGGEAGRLDARHARAVRTGS